MHVERRFYAKKNIKKLGRAMPLVLAPKACSGVIDTKLAFSNKITQQCILLLMTNTTFINYNY